MIYALQTLAKAMEDVPGRKILVLLTAGLPMNNDVRYSSRRPWRRATRRM